MNNRTCKVCGIEQPMESFKPLNQGKHRLWTCYSCVAKRAAQNPNHLLHGMADRAKARCEDPTHPSYPFYGGKGIEYKLDKKKFICENLDVVQALLNRGETPSIDRIDPSKGYVDDNVRIIPLKDNSEMGSITAMIEAKKKRDRTPQVKCNTCVVEKLWTEEFFGRVGGVHVADDSPILSRECKECINARHREKGRDYRKRENRDMVNRNAKRRERHRWRMENDPEYREKVKERNRRAQVRRKRK